MCKRHLDDTFCRLSTMNKRDRQTNRQTDHRTVTSMSPNSFCMLGINSKSYESYYIQDVPSGKKISFAVSRAYKCHSLLGFTFMISGVFDVNV